MPPARPKDEAPDDKLTEDEEAALEEGLRRLQEEKRRALAEPGATWREWFLVQGAKWYLGLVFLIVDVWLALLWTADAQLSPLGAAGMVLTLAPALYLEALVYLYFWKRPSPDAPRRIGRFRPSWKGLREIGRWTPEEFERRKRGLAPGADDGSPSPSDFL